jgi:nucleotide-binding universal stress UspA family protein
MRATSDWHARKWWSRFTITVKEIPMKAVIAIDGSTESALAVETARSLAWPAGTQLTVLTVLPTDAQLFGGPWGVGVAYVPSESLRDNLEVEGRRTLDEATARLRRQGLYVIAQLGQGRPASVIVETARQTNADLIILGARGHGVIEGALLGSVSAEVVDQAHSAVLVARCPSTCRILIGTDGSEVADSAIAFVGGSGLFRGAESRVVCAIDLQADWWLGFTPEDAAFVADAYATAVEEGRRHADGVVSVAADALRSNGLLPSTGVLDGPAAAAIDDEAESWHADVVAVGTRGNGLLKRLVLGSTARSLLHHAGASVLITRGTSGPIATDHLAATPTPASTAP